MKRLSITLLVLFGSIAILSARERTMTELKSIALHQLQKTATGQVSAKAKKQNIQAGDIEILQRSEAVSVVGFQSGGYVVITNDDNFNAVVGYSDSQFSTETNPAFLWWLQNINESYQELYATGKSPAYVVPSTKYASKVDALLTTKWGQSAPFNDLCPEYTSNGLSVHFVSGCVATSMSQVMNYHQYPTKGSGTKSYFFSYGEDSRIRASANFGRTTYDYANMLDEYKSSANGTPYYSTTEATAVATLMYHAGVSVQMSYTPDGSGAYSADACRALRNYFLYDKNIKMFYRPYYPIEEWMDMVFTELNDGCPIIYGGSSNSGGHSFVIDGYDATGKVHVNWGWDGTSDGYFDIANLRGYNNGQDMILVRRPDDTRFNSIYYSIWGLRDNLIINRDGYNLTVSQNVMYNFDVDNFTGSWGLLATNLSTGNTTVLFSSAISDEVEYLHGIQFSVSNISVEDLADGDYRIYIGTKSNAELNWRAVRAHENINNSYLFTKSGSIMSLESEDNSNWTAPTGIDAVPYSTQQSNSNSTTAGIYTLQGQKIGSSLSDVTSNYHGVVILRQGNSAKKVVLK